MPHPGRNRVTPTGELVATSLRGAWMGNRGILHDDDGQLVRHHASSLWITCALSYKGWRAQQWAPHHYTVLFFHDEAVALAAGHRPCALCRRQAYAAFQDAVAEAAGTTRLSAAALDRRLHSERLLPRTSRSRLHPMAWNALPTGVFVLVDERPCLVFDDQLVPWTLEGYAWSRLPRPAAGEALVLTPPTTTAAIRVGYVPQVDDSVRA